MKPPGFALLGPLLLLLVPLAAVGEPLAMVFRDKPPYSYVDDGKQKGFLLDRVKQILAAAKVEAKYEIVPPKRIFADIAANRSEICSFGWYKIPEREAYAKFSASIHEDKPHVILAGPRSRDAITRHKSLRELMADTSLLLGVVDGVSYGPEIDALIAAFRGPVERALIPPLQLARKVAAERVDFMFIDQEDLDYLTQSNPELSNDNLKKISYTDLPPGLKRYILCSEKVSDETMARINQAIARIAPGK